MPLGVWTCQSRSNCRHGINKCSHIPQQGTQSRWTLLISLLIHCARANKPKEQQATQLRMSKKSALNAMRWLVFYQWCFWSRNVGDVTPKKQFIFIIFENNFLMKASKNMVYFILRTEALTDACTDTLIRTIQEWPRVTGLVFQHVDSSEQCSGLISLANIRPEWQCNLQWILVYFWYYNVTHERNLLNGQRAANWGVGDAQVWVYGSQWFCIGLYTS